MKLLFENWRHFLKEQNKSRVITFDFDDTLSLSHWGEEEDDWVYDCLLYTSPSPRDGLLSRMPSSA